MNPRLFLLIATLFLLFTSAIMAGVPRANAAVIFDNFDAGGGFHPADNSVAASANRFGFESATRAAVRFTVTGGDHSLDSVTLPISIQSLTTGNFLRVRLAADNAGAPGTTLEVLSVNQGIWPPTSNPFTTTTTLSSTTHPVLSNGASYWIVTELTSFPAGDPVSVDYRWFLNTSGSPVLFRQQQRNDGSLPTDPWTGFSGALAMAFRVEGTASSLAIHDIQGSGSTSPFVGQVVTTTGVVTGRRSDGFFIQTTDVEVDADPNTSEGILIFTSSAPLVAIGDIVSVTGNVVEFIPSVDPSSPPRTEIISPTVTLFSTGNPLPATIMLTAFDTDPAGSLEQLERFEAMRVHVDALTVIAPSQGTVDEPNASSVSNGVFYGVITDIARPFREPGIAVPDPLPAGSPCCIPRFDANPERLGVDSDGQIGAPSLEITSGATVINVTGALDYSSRSYTILPDPPPSPSPVVNGNRSAVPVPVPGPDEFTVASFSMNRFFDTTNDPNVSDVVLTPTAFNNRLNKASLAIRNVMRTPDVIGIEEMENLSTLQTLASKINFDAVAAGDPDPNYQPYLVEGNDPGGIDVGFLVKAAPVTGSTPRVSVSAVAQELADRLFVNPDASTVLLHDRPPLRLMAVVNDASGPSFPVTVIVNHLRSLSSVDATTPGANGWSTEGARVRAKRQQQAEDLANLVQARQTSDPTERIIVIGNFNAFQFNDGYVDMMGTIKGTPTPPDNVVLASSDLVNPDLTNLVDLAPEAERYSVVDLRGNAEDHDHMLITGNLLSRFSALRYARTDADFPESFRNDPARPERISDHDPPVAYFGFPPPIGVQAPGPRFALHRITPNPIVGELVVSLSLVSDHRAELQLIDIAGRVVTSRLVGSLGPGTHRVSFGGSKRLAPGVYVVRLSQDDHAATARAVVLR